MLGPPSLRAHFFGHPSICRKSRLHERVMLGGYCPTMAGARSQGGSGQPRGRSRTVWREARKSAVYGAALLAVYAMLLALYLRCLPGLSEQERHVLLHRFPPKTLQELVTVRDIALGYSSTNQVIVALGMCMVYIMMQTFAVPGTLSLSILSGAILGLGPGLTFVTVVNAVGSSCCYCLSWWIGKPVAKALWPSKLEAFKEEATRQRSHMFNYMIFLRLTPVLPNVFINVASPIVGVPLFHFFWGTFFGCIPNNSVAVSAGSRLSEIKSLRDLYSYQMLLFGCVAGCIALLPVILKKHQHKLHSHLQRKSSYEVTFQDERISVIMTDTAALLLSETTPGHYLVD